MADDPVPLLAPPAAGPRDPAPVTLSVLVPAYNAAATIGEALESAVSQVPPPHEIIVSDDGSEDDLETALRPFRDRIRLVRDVNGGLAVARNRAAAVATGTHLALLDADDIWLPGRTAAFTAAARARPDLDVITTDAVVVRDGRPDEQTYYEVRGWPSEPQRDAILRNNFIFGAAAIRRAAFEAVGGYDERIRYAEDWDLYLRMLLSGSAAGLVESPLYEYRRRDDSLTGQRLPLALGVLSILDRVDRSSLSPPQQAILRSTVTSWKARAADEALRGGGPGSARVALSMLRDPRALAVEARQVATSAGLRRRLRPYRAKARVWLDQADPSRIALGSRKAAPSKVAFVCVYRRRNAAIVSRLLDRLPPSATVRLWSLDEVPPVLARHTYGQGPGSRFGLHNRLVAAIEPGDRAGGLVVADDDVEFVVGDAARLLRLGAALGFDLFQPSHSGDSFASESSRALVRKQRLAVGRRTTYVEQGPLIVLSRRAQDLLVPFPEDLGMGWGAEVRWSRAAVEHDLRLGVVDAAVIRHLVPPGGSYDTLAEEQRLADELESAGVTGLAELQSVLERSGLRDALRLRSGDEHV